MEVQATQSPTQGLTQSQAVELLKQRRAAAQQQTVKPEQDVAVDDAENEAPPENENQESEENDVETENDVQDETDVDADNEVDPAEEPTINYVVDGKPQVASLKEAKEALASVKHLSRLRNEIVENHRKTQTEVQEVQAQRQEVVGRLQEVEQLLMSGLPSQADMQKMLDANDNTGYLKAQQAHQRFAAVRQYKQQEEARLQHEQELARRQREDMEAQELVKARPEFKKPEYVQKVVSFLKDDWAYDDAFISTLGARELQIVDDARKWREWNMNKSVGIKKAIEKSVRPSKPIAPQNVDLKQINALRSEMRENYSQDKAMKLLQLNRKIKGQ